MQSRTTERQPAVDGAPGAAQVAGAPARAVSNRSMARLLGSAGPVGAQAAAPQVLSRLAAQQARAPEDAVPEPSTDPLVVTEEFEPAPGNGTTEDGLGVQVVADDAAASAAPRIQFVDGGRVSPSGHGAAGPHDCVPRAMVGLGRTGNVAWAGGGGAGPHGNEAVGSVQLSIPPVYQSQSNGLLSDSEAWVMPGTGLIIVYRSFVGSNAGDQGNGWWVTAAASAKLDQHEQTHVQMTQLAYDLNLTPMESRLTERRSAYTQAGAIAALKSYVGWEDAIKGFQTWDDLYNFPMKVVDTADLASGTYVVDSGPGTVAGTAFTHRLRIPSEGNPAP